MAAAQKKKIDFTVMYATHNAFRRDLERLTSASMAGKVHTPQVRAGWQNIKHQLHVHHTVEDSDLWPRIHRKVAGQSQHLALLQDMEAEHSLLDPLLAAVDEAMATRSPTLTEQIKELATVLDAHMQHEEEAALPLIQEVLTVLDWRAFSAGMARAQRVKGAAVYVPWVIDGVPDADRQRFLNAMPPPIRVLNRLSWESRYRQRELFHF